MLNHDEDHKTINLEMCNQPVAITGDGCSLYDLATKIRLISPNMRCESHAADGSLERIVNLKTINISAVTEFLPFF